MSEARVQWYSHILHAKGGNVRKTGLNLEVPRKQPRATKATVDWQLHQDLKMAKLHPDQTFDREKWRQHSRKADPTTKRDKRWRRIIRVSEIQAGKLQYTEIGNFLLSQTLLFNFYKASSMLYMFSKLFVFCISCGQKRLSSNVVKYSPGKFSGVCLDGENEYYIENPHPSNSRRVGFVFVEPLNPS